MTRCSIPSAASSQRTYTSLRPSGEDSIINPWKSAAGTSSSRSRPSGSARYSAQTVSGVSWRHRSFADSAPMMARRPSGSHVNDSTSRSMGRVVTADPSAGSMVMAMRAPTIDTIPIAVSSGDQATDFTS